MNSDLPELNDFTRPLVERLQRHPKRVIFTEGEDERILCVAEQLVRLKAVIPILIGDKDRIKKMAADLGVDMEFIRVVTPEKSSDLEVFCERYARAEQMFGREVIGDVRELMKDPVRFASMMALYNYADAVVAGNKLGNAYVTRGVVRYKRAPEKNNPLLTISVMVSESFKQYGGDGIIFLADTGVNCSPSVEDLAYFALETGKMARHLLGHAIQISMLSCSTAGSLSGMSADNIRAATVLAQQKFCEENIMDVVVEGEIQADAAISPAAYNIRVKHSALRRSSDVLIFPSLDAADITKKMMGFIPSVRMYGQFLEDIIFPIALVTRMTREERIFGTALAVANRAILFHQLYPDGVVLLDEEP